MLHVHLQNNAACPEAGTCPWLNQTPVSIWIRLVAPSHDEASRAPRRAAPQSRAETIRGAFPDWQLLLPTSTPSCILRNCGRHPSTGSNTGVAGRMEYPVGRKKNNHLLLDSQPSSCAFSGELRRRPASFCGCDSSKEAPSSDPKQRSANSRGAGTSWPKQGVWR